MVLFTAITCPKVYIPYYLTESPQQAWEKVIIFQMKNLRLKIHCWFVAGLEFKGSLFFLTSSFTMPDFLLEGEDRKLQHCGEGDNK